jgi:hypothetical protein
MKQIFLLPFIAGLLLAGCDEEPPPIRFTDPEKPLLDTMYTALAPTPDLKQALLMDVTGVGCSNCPEAAVLAKNIQNANPGRINLLAVYPFIFPNHPLTNPSAGYDTLANDDAEGLVSNLGSIVGLPVGIIDQTKLSGSSFIAPSSWASTVSGRLALTPPANIKLNSSWITTDNKGRLEIKVAYHQNLPTGTKNLLYIGIVEDNIVGKQSNKDAPGGYDYKYKFSHVLRKLITPVTGDTLKADLTAGRVFEKHYYIKPRYNWNPDNLNALVWIVDVNSKEILQSAEVKLKP